MDDALAEHMITLTRPYRCDVCETEWSTTEEMPRDVFVLPPDDHDVDPITRGWAHPMPRVGAHLVWDTEEQRCAACVRMCGWPDAAGDDEPGSAKRSPARQAASKRNIRKAWAERWPKRKAAK